MKPCSGIQVQVYGYSLTRSESSTRKRHVYLTVFLYWISGIALFFSLQGQTLGCIITSSVGVYPLGITSTYLKVMSMCNLFSSSKQVDHRLLFT